MGVSQTNSVKQKLIAKGKAIQPPHLDAPLQLSMQLDFREEKGALEKLTESYGYTMIKSPKCHPEVAGCGIEYCWGHSKIRFRNTWNSHVPTKLADDIFNTFTDDEAELPQERIFRYARMARDYIRGYKAIRDAKAGNNKTKVSEVTKELIEKMKKKYKSHRNIMDMCSGFIKQTVFTRIM